MVSETRTIQHEWSLSPSLAEANTTTPQYPPRSQNEHSDVDTLSEGDIFVCPTSAHESSTPLQEVMTPSEHNNSVGPASAHESSSLNEVTKHESSKSSTPSQEVETPSEGDTSVSPTSAHESSTHEQGNVTLISSDEETSVHVTLHDSSKSTLMSSMSTSKTDEELATGIVDLIITIIEPVQEPPETPRCKF